MKVEVSMFKKYIIITFFIVLIISVIACSNIMSNSKNTVAISGKVVTSSKNSILIQDEKNDRYAISLNNSTKFKSGLSEDFSEGNIVTIIYNGVVAESDPMQITAMEITQNEQIISLDPREIVSGIIGDFPMVILDKNTPTLEMTIDTTFAVTLTYTGDKNPWEYEVSIDSGIEILNEGSDMGIGAEKKYYWGFKTLLPGEHKIIFTNNENNDEITFTVITNE